MTRRTCRGCGRTWLTFGPRDPCPDCGLVARLEIGSDVLPVPSAPVRPEAPELWAAQVGMDDADGSGYAGSPMA